MSGIQPWSAPSMELVIFEVNPEHRKDFAAFLQWTGVWYKPVLGSWHGEVNPGYVIAREYFDNIRRILPWYFEGEEAYLVLGNVGRQGARPATVVSFADGSEEYLGLFFSVAVDEIEDDEDWTQDPENNLFYVIREKHLTAPHEKNAEAVWKLIDKIIDGQGVHPGILVETLRKALPRPL